MGVK
jgi:hypothetical protein